MSRHAYAETTASFSPTADTQIAKSAATTNYGGVTSLKVDGDDPTGSGEDKYALLKFDLSSIPTTATIQSAKLTTNVTNGSWQSYEIYALKKAWSESAATWQSSGTSGAWATAGAKGATDRESTVLGSLSANSAGSATNSLNSSGISKVQSWVQKPSSNYGFVIADTTNDDGIGFDSKEGTSAPKLQVTYTDSSSSPPPSPPSTPIFSDGFERDSDTFVPPWSNGCWGPRGGITTDPSMARKGSQSGRFTVYDGDCTSYPTRALLRWQQHLCEGDERFIGYSMYLPSDFPNPNPGWMNLGQFGYGPPWGYPPIHFSYWGNGSTTAMTVYNQNTVSLGNIPVKLGAWNDLVLHERFSSNSSVGYLEVWKDAKPVTFKNGSTRVYTNTLRTDATGCGSLDLQQYRQGGVWPSPLTVWFDEVKVGSSYTDVAP